MKKYVITVVASIILLLSLTNLNNNVSAQGPDYEKYGRIAIAVIKEDFPGEEVRDYKYLGRKQNSEDEVADSFQFKVMDEGKPVLATVQITHNLKNDKLLTLSVAVEAQQ